MKKRQRMSLLIKLLSWQFAGRHDCRAMQVVTCADTVVEMEHQHHQQDPLKERMIIVVHKNDERLWPGGAVEQSQDIPDPPYIKGLISRQIKTEGSSKSGLKKSKIFVV